MLWTTGLVTAMGAYNNYNQDSRLLPTKDEVSIPVKNQLRSVEPSMWPPTAIMDRSSLQKTQRSTGRPRQVASPSDPAFESAPADNSGGGSTDVYVEYLDKYGGVSGKKVVGFNVPVNVLAMEKDVRDDHSVKGKAAQHSTINRSGHMHAQMHAGVGARRSMTDPKPAVPLKSLESETFESRPMTVEETDNLMREYEREGAAFSGTRLTADHPPGDYTFYDHDSSHPFDSGKPHKWNTTPFQADFELQQQRARDRRGQANPNPISQGAIGYHIKQMNKLGWRE